MDALVWVDLVIPMREFIDANVHEEEEVRVED